MERLHGALSSTGGLYGGLSGENTLSGDLAGGYEGYSGAYEITPSLETQTLPTSRRLLAEDIVVKPEKNFQIYTEYAYTQKTSLTETRAKITVAKAGKYRISWVGIRVKPQAGGTSGYGSQLYVNGRAIGPEYTGFGIVNVEQSYSVTNVRLNKNDVVAIYARAGSSSGYTCIANLIVQEID